MEFLFFLQLSVTLKTPAFVTINRIQQTILIGQEKLVAPLQVELDQTMTIPMAQVQVITDM